MCKEIKRLTLLSKCTHLSKTDRDSITWAIQQIEPPVVEPEKGFGGFDFSKWPSLPSPALFAEYVKARKSKHKLIMTQAWIDTVTPHMIDLTKADVNVNQALEIATASGWRVIKSMWVLSQLQGDSDNGGDDEITAENIRDKIKNGNVTNISQIPKNLRGDLDSDVRFDRIKNENYLNALLGIGFAL